MLGIVGNDVKYWDYDTSMIIYSVPSRLRKNLRFALKEVLPIIKQWQNGNNKNHELTICYQRYNRSKWEPLDRGGLYIVQDRFKDKEKLIHRNTNFNLDKELKELVK